MSTFLAQTSTLKSGVFSSIWYCTYNQLFTRFCKNLMTSTVPNGGGGTPSPVATPMVGVAFNGASYTERLLSDWKLLLFKNEFDLLSWVSVLGLAVMHMVSKQYHSSLNDLSVLWCIPIEAMSACRMYVSSSLIRLYLEPGANGIL